MTGVWRYDFGTDVSPVAAGYGLYLAAVMTVFAIVLSVLAMAVAWGQT